MFAFLCAYAVTGLWVAGDLPSCLAKPSLPADALESIGQEPPWHRK